jgi:hypothetical protein
VGAPDRVCAGLGQAHGADEARVDHFGDRADRLLDRDGRVHACGPVYVHVIGSEAVEAVGEEVLDSGGPRVDAAERVVWAAKRAELDAHDDLLALAAFERAAQEQLVVAHAVEVPGVEQRDAGVERGANGCDALRVVRRPVRTRHRHAAETDRRHLGTTCAEVMRAHRAFAYSDVPAGSRASASSSKEHHQAIFPSRHSATSHIGRSIDAPLPTP